MDISLFLAKVMGLYFVIISLSVLINKNRMLSIITGIIQNPSLQFMMGLNILIIGIILILSHNVWVASWQIIITIISWLILFKGILNITFPSLAQSMTKPFLHSQVMPYISVLINFLLGLFLCYYGFMLPVI